MTLSTSTKLNYFGYPGFGSTASNNYISTTSNSSATSTYSGVKIDKNGIGKCKEKETVLKKISNKYQMIEHGKLFPMYRTIIVERTYYLNTI